MSNEKLVDDFCNTYQQEYANRYGGQSRLNWDEFKYLVNEHLNLFGVCLVWELQVSKDLKHLFVLHPAEVVACPKNDGYPNGYYRVWRSGMTPPNLLGRFISDGELWVHADQVHRIISEVR